METCDEECQVKIDLNQFWHWTMVGIILQMSIRTTQPLPWGRPPILNNAWVVNRIYQRLATTR